MLTGIVLLFHYRANTAEAFASIQHILRNENYLWFWYDLHQWGTNVLFFCCYSYFFLSLWQRHYNYWKTKLIIFLLLLASAYTGNILPQSQLSLWLSQAISHIDLTKAFLSHVIFIPLILIILFFVIKQKQHLGFPASQARLRMTTATIYFIITSLAIYFILALSFPELFSQSLASVDPNLNLPVLYYSPPWYLATIYGLYKITGIVGLVFTGLILLMAPYFTRHIDINWQKQFYPIAASLLILSFIGFTILSMYLYDARNLFLTRCVVIFYFLTWLAIASYALWELYVKA